MNNQTDIKAYVNKHYQSIRYETTYGLRRLLIDLPLEQYGLEETSVKYQLLSYQIEMARDELNARTASKRR